MINTLKTLCALSGVSSFEDEVRDYIRQRVTPYATDLRVDAMGNLIVLKKGARATGNKLMLCAHMDEVGLIIKSITEDGYLKFGCVGGIDRRVLLGKQVALGEQKVTGVIGLKAIHMTTAEERKKVPKLEEYYIDIGVKSREEAEKLVGIGDCGVFVSDVVEFGDGMLKAKAIDDRVGCAVMLKLLQEESTQRKGFELIVAQYSEQLYWQIRRMVLSHEDANDLLQNTFIKAWTNIDYFRAEAKLSTWLYRIALNECLTFLNRQRATTTVAIDDPEAAIVQKLESDPYYSGDQVQMLLQKALLTLPEKQRMVFNLKYYQEMKYEEMSEIFGTSVGALKASYHHAVKKIEKFLEEVD